MEELIHQMSHADNLQIRKLTLYSSSCFSSGALTVVNLSIAPTYCLNSSLNSFPVASVDDDLRRGLSSVEGASLELSVRSKQTGDADSDSCSRRATLELLSELDSSSCGKGSNTMSLLI